MLQLIFDFMVFALLRHGCVIKPAFACDGKQERLLNQKEISVR